MHDTLKEIDTKELKLPDTIFVRDIENRVFQSLALQCLAKIEGIDLIEGGFIDTLLGRDLERVKGIFVEQDQKTHSVNLRIEINVFYGVCIPDKAEEIQNKLVEEVSLQTGLHVGSIHLVFKNMVAKSVREENKEEAPAYA